MQTLIEEKIVEFCEKWPDAATHPNSNGLNNWLRTAFSNFLDAQKKETIERAVDIIRVGISAEDGFLRERLVKEVRELL